MEIIGKEWGLQSLSFLQPLFSSQFHHLGQEAPEDPTGMAPTDINNVNQQGSVFWCNPNVEKCGWATWGNWIQPQTGWNIYYAIALWQVAITTVIYN